MTIPWTDWRERLPLHDAGTLHESKMDKARRRGGDIHYTNDKDILKVIDSLFMDDLRARIERLHSEPGRDGMAEARRTLGILGTIHVLDPACGSGNFLAVALRELQPRCMVSEHADLDA